MAKKLCMIAMIGLILVLAGLIAGDIYVSKEITSLLGEVGSEAAPFADQWTEIQNARQSTVFFAGVFFIIVFAIVWKIGPEKKVSKEISQKEARKIAADLMEDYRKKGIYVEARDDEEEEDIITEMEMPKLKTVRFEGDKVVVEWQPVPNATGYYVWRKRENEEWCKIKKIKKAVCKYKDSDIEEKTKYAYAIKSYYETEGIRVISKKDPLGMDIYVLKVQKQEGRGEA